MIIILNKHFILQWGISFGLSFAVFCPRYLQNLIDLSPSNHVFNNFIPSYAYTTRKILQINQIIK